MESWIVRRALFLQTLRARLKLIMQAFSKGILYFARTHSGIDPQRCCKCYQRSHHRLALECKVKLNY